MICKLTKPDGTVVEIQGFAEDFVDTPRKWWKETEDGFDLRTVCGKILSVTPRDKQDFYEKHLENLKDSLESPFKLNIKESE